MDYDISNRKNTKAILISILILCLIWYYFIFIARADKNISDVLPNKLKFADKIKNLFGISTDTSTELTDVPNISNPFDTSNVIVDTSPEMGPIIDPVNGLARDPVIDILPESESSLNKCVIQGYNVRGFSLIENNDEGVSCSYNSSWDQDNIINSSCHANQTFNSDTNMEEWDEKCGKGLLEYGNKSSNGILDDNNRIKNKYDRIGEEIALASSVTPYVGRNSMCDRGKDLDDRLDGCMTC